MTKSGTVYWNELATWKPEEAKAYYAAVLGWEYRSAPTAATDDPRPYFIALKDGRPVAGIFTLSSAMFDGVPEHWFVYLAVDDLGLALAKSNANGGRVCREPFDIPGFGKLAVVADRNGAVMGLIEPVGLEASL